MLGNLRAEDLLFEFRGCFVSLISVGKLQQLVSTHGYWVVALIVGLESMGLPLPGETILVLAAIYAATEPSFNVWVVIAVAAFGAIVGDNAGYWLGRRYGYALWVIHVVPRCSRSSADFRNAPKADLVPGIKAE